MVTILVEIERIINNRPLTYVSGDLTEEALTPSHLICGKRLGQNKCTDFIDNITDANSYVQKTVFNFWQRWSKEYLTELRDKQKKGNIRNNVPPPNIGDIVLISNDNCKRIKWRTGRVLELIKGKDGRIRGASVCIVNKDGIGKLRRPLTKLFPFEVEKT